jgi:hypothetical protein
MRHGRVVLIALELNQTFVKAQLKHIPFGLREAL